jgi:hypothetical protein
MEKALRKFRELSELNLYKIFICLPAFFIFSDKLGFTFVEKYKDE